MISPGVHLGSFFGFSIPVVVKKISTGNLDKRMIVDVLPYLGMRLKFWKK